MAFNSYAAFPEDVRHMVIQAAVADQLHETQRISSLATVNREWKNVVEKEVFSNITITVPQDLTAFSTICGARNTLLKVVTCEFRPVNNTVYIGMSPAHLVGASVGNSLSRLFNIMVNWDRPGLNTMITLGLNVIVFTGGDLLEFSIDPAALTNLPQLPVIGKLNAQLGFGYGDVLLSQGSITGLLAKLPNVHGVHLTLPLASTGIGRDLAQSINTTRNNIVATHTVKPNLTKIQIVSDNNLSKYPAFHPTRERQKQVAMSLAPSLAVWKDSLTSMKLDCIMDVPEVLFVAAGAHWRNLATLDLVGVVDDDFHPFREQDDPIAACDDLLRALVAALPNMPSLAKVGAGFRSADYYLYAFNFCMDIGPRRGKAREVRHLNRRRGDPHKCAIAPCRPVPADHATAKAQGVIPNGNLVTALQAAVRAERGMELAVFACVDAEHLYTDRIGGRVVCRQWDQEEWEWDLVLRNGLHPLIYNHGLLWEEGYFRRG